MKIIGIAGKAGCGKNTVADFLTEHYGYEQISFAAILKDMLRVMGFPEPTNRDLKEAKIEGYDFSWRHLAQTLGTDWARDMVQKDIWITLTMRNLDPNGKYVFSDVRFEGEQQAILGANGIMIHLEGRSVDLGEAASHASEKPLTPLHNSFVVHNTGSLEYLYDKIRVIVGAGQAIAE